MNWLVIGSGFSALSFLGSLQSRDVFWIDLTDQGGTAPLLEFEVQEGGFFSQYAANRNACVGGGLATWGAVVTPLATGCFECEHDNDREWLTALVEASKVTPNTLWRDVFDSQRTTERHPVTPRAFSQLVNPSGFKRVQMTYVRRPELKKVLYLLGRSGHELRVGRFVNICKTGHQFYELSYLDPSGEVKTIKAHNLVLASGSFLNCCLLFELTGQAVFPIANHLSTTAARLILKRPTRFKHYVQSFQGPQDSFSVWFDDSTPQACSVRLVPDDGRPLDVINFEGGIFMGAGLKKDYSFVYRRLLRKINFYDTFLINLMLETHLSSTNQLHVRKLENSRATWRISVELRIDEDLLMLGIKLVDRFTSLFEPLSATKSVEKASWMRTPRVGTGETLKNFIDSAHYFGSVPCSLVAADGAHLTVDSSLRLRNNKNIWVLGNCVLPSAGCAHPTELISQLAFASGKKAVEEAQTKI